MGSGVHGRQGCCGARHEVASCMAMRRGAGSCAGTWRRCARSGMASMSRRRPCQLPRWAPWLQRQTRGHGSRAQAYPTATACSSSSIQISCMVGAQHPTWMSAPALGRQLSLLVWICASCPCQQALGPAQLRPGKCGPQQWHRHPQAMDICWKGPCLLRAEAVAWELPQAFKGLPCLQRPGALHRR